MPTSLSGPIMMDQKKYIIPYMVNLNCDGYVSFITNDDITGEHWMIGNDPESDMGDLEAEAAGYLWPHQVSSWKYCTVTFCYYGNSFESDPQLTVTGNTNSILCLNIYVISSVEGAVAVKTSGQKSL